MDLLVVGLGAFHGDGHDLHLVGFATGTDQGEMRILLYVVSVGDAFPSAVLNFDF